VNYIINQEGEYRRTPDMYADATWALALLGDSRAPLWWNQIDPKKLSRHGYVAYMFAAEKLGKYNQEMYQEYSRLRTSPSDGYYWTLSADDALVVQLLLGRAERDIAFPMLDKLVRSLDLRSYFVSTQEKNQILLALIQFQKGQTQNILPLTMAFRSDGIISEMNLTKASPLRSLEVSRQKIGGQYTLKREKNRGELYVTTTTLDRPKDMKDLSPFSTG
jgi:hypothetical protein